MLVLPLLLAAAVASPGRIAFWSDRAGDPDVFTMNADGSDARNLGTSDWGDKRASWSPDGERIAYDSWHVGHRDFHIWVMNADGSAKRQLTTSPLRDVLPAWSPTRGGNRDVYVMNADGSGAQDLTRDPADDWADTWR